MLVRSDDDLELCRTPCHEQDLFGLLFNVNHPDIIEVVPESTNRDGVALESDGSLIKLVPSSTPTDWALEVQTTPKFLICNPRETGDRSPA